jgi:hypothetical protein
MADTKISALPASTTPLAGTEVLPIVQSSTTKKVSVENLTLGRSVGASNFIPSGSAAPTNGMYLPTTNTVGMATNSAEVFRMDSGQRTNFGGTSFADNYKVVVTFDGGANNGMLLTQTNSSGGTPSFLALIDARNLNNSTDTAYYNDSAGQKWSLKRNGGLWNYQANNLNLSDEREKTNFNFSPTYLEKLCRVPVETFLFIDQSDSDLNLGVRAQNLQKECPELVAESNWGTEKNPKIRLSIYETDLKYAMLKALQELKEQFDAYVASHP